MGNCHAVDPVSATVEHPDGKVEKLYFSSSARQLMLQHPGHYVALLPPPPPPSPDGSVVHVKRKLKLLPPDSMLNVGSCYKLVSFEDVLSELSDNGNMAHQTHRRLKPRQQAKVAVSEHKVAEQQKVEGQQQGVSKAAVKHINQLRTMLSNKFLSQQHQQQKENSSPQEGVVPELSRGISRSYSSPLESVRPVARGAVWRPNLQSIAERAGR